MFVFLIVLELFHHSERSHGDETPTIVDVSSIKLYVEAFFTVFDDFFCQMRGFWSKFGVLDPSIFTVKKFQSYVVT